MTDASQISGEIKLDQELTLADDFSPPSYDEWKATAEAALKGASFEKKLITRTYEGIDLQPIYNPADIDGLPHLQEKPGFAGNVRGARAAGYVKKAWEINQDTPASSPKEFNQVVKHDLERGQTGISMLLDTLVPNGVPVHNENDFAEALAGIDLEKYPLHIIPGYPSLDFANLLKDFVAAQGMDAKKITGSIDNDPFAFLVSKGYIPGTEEAIFKTMADTLKFAETNLPNVKTIGVCGIPYHNAGADAVSELAYVLATAVHYIDRLIELGIDIDTIARNIRFTFPIGPFYFMEVAKIRAARLLWSKIVKAYGGSDDAAKMTIHGNTSLYNQTILDPYVNMLRTTTEAFAGIVAGVDSLSTNPFDQSFATLNEFSRRAARNTQIVLKEECNLDRLIDPAGGSYYLEKLTHQVTEKTWALFQQIEADGGMLEALKKGIPQQQCEEVAKKRRKDIAKRKSMIIGTNFSANVTETLPATPPKPKQATETVSGDAIKVTPLQLHRQSGLFEELRIAVQQHAAKTGSETGPKFFLATMGSLAQYKARADFSQGFFEVGGFHAVYPPKGFDTPETAVEAALDSGANVVVICSTDDTYPELVPAITKGLKEKNKDIIIVLAGYPKDQIEQHKQAGVDEFIYLGADAYEVLSGILKQLGVLS